MLPMNFFRRFRSITLLLALALFWGGSMAARADDIQDAYKLIRQKQYDLAMEKINGVLAKKPKDIQARYAKGVILIEKGKTEDAIEEFQSLTEDAPDRPEPYNNLGFLYALQGQYDKARAAMEMAIRIQPTYAMAHENLGDIYAKLASKEYERALHLDPNNDSPQKKLATIRQLFPKRSASSRSMTLPAAASAPAAASPSH